MRKLAAMPEHQTHTPQRTRRFICFLLFWTFAAFAQVASAQDILLRVDDSTGLSSDSHTATFDRGQLDALPQQEFTTSTIWTDAERLFSGPALHDVLDAADVSGDTVHLVAANGYEARMPRDAIKGTVPIVATNIDGKPFSVREKGPLWVVFPYDLDANYQTEEVYAWSIWQLTGVRVSE